MKKSILNAAAVVSLAALATACSANADTSAKDESMTVSTTMDPVVQATTNAKNTAAVRTVDDAYTAMREIRAARLAIFDGSGPAAKSFVNDAAEKLAAAKTEAAKIALKTTEPEADGGYIPFDMSMTIAEDFTASPAKAEKIKEANGHLAKGHHKKAQEVLRLADINVLTAAALLPVDKTMNAIARAEAFLEQGKYYDANLVLKGIEDGVIIQTYDVDGKPVVAPAKAAEKSAEKPAAKTG
jgi:YfdX protein